MIKKAIFLDRDGVLISNKDHYYIWKPEQLNLLPQLWDIYTIEFRDNYQSHIPLKDILLLYFHRTLKKQ